MAKIIGQVEITAGGITFEVLPGATLNPGGVTRQSVMSTRGRAGFTETVTAASVTCTIVFNSTADIVTLRDMTGATLMFDCGNGVSYVVRNADVLNPPPLDSGAGTYEVTLEGDPAERM